VPLRSGVIKQGPSRTAAHARGSFVATRASTALPRSAATPCSVHCCCCRFAARRSSSSAASLSCLARAFCNGCRARGGHRITSRQRHSPPWPPATRRAPGGGSPAPSHCGGNERPRPPRRAPQRAAPLVPRAAPPRLARIAPNSLMNRWDQLVNKLASARSRRSSIPAACPRGDSSTGASPATSARAARHVPAEHQPRSSSSRATTPSTPSGAAGGQVGREAGAGRRGAAARGEPPAGFGGGGGVGRLASSSPACFAARHTSPPTRLLCSTQASVCSTCPGLA